MKSLQRTWEEKGTGKLSSCPNTGRTVDQKKRRYNGRQHRTQQKKEKQEGLWEKEKLTTKRRCNLRGPRTGKNCKAKAQG